MKVRESKPTSKIIELHDRRTIPINRDLSSVKKIDGFKGTKVREYDNMDYRILHDLKRENLEIKENLQRIYLQLSRSINELSSTHEGSDNSEMEQLREKVNNIERDVAVLEERTKVLDKLPTRDEIKNIVTEVIDNHTKDLATKEHVQVTVLKSKDSILTWTIPLMIGVVTIATSIIIAVL